MKYSEKVMRAVRQGLGLEASDTSRDEIINSMNSLQVWDRYLRWNCLIGYGEDLHDAHESIFGPAQRAHN